MAKKKTKKKSGARRKSRKVGAATAAEGVLIMGASAIAGALAAPFLVQALDTAAGGKIPLAATRGGVAVAGGFLSFFGVKEKQPMLEGLGFGVSAMAAVMTANELGLNVPGIAGIPAVGVHPSRHSRRRMNGIRAVGDTITTGNPTRKAMGIGALYAN